MPAWYRLPPLAHQLLIWWLRPHPALIIIPFPSLQANFAPWFSAQPASLARAGKSKKLIWSNRGFDASESLLAGTLSHILGADNLAQIIADKIG